jgi:hypothetical protein
MRRGAYLTSAPQPLHPMIFQARKRACPHTVSHVTCVQIFFSMPHHRDRHYRDHTLRPDKTRVRPPAAPQSLVLVIFQARKRASHSHVTCVQISSSMPHNQEDCYTTIHSLYL